MVEWIDFVAACGHKTTARQLGHICPQCFLETHEALAALRAQLAESERKERVAQNVADKWAARAKKAEEEVAHLRRALDE